MTVELAFESLEQKADESVQHSGQDSEPNAATERAAMDNKTTFKDDSEDDF